MPRDLVRVFVEEELLAFPFGDHDDALDALSRIYDLPLRWPSKQVPGTVTGVMTSEWDALAI